MREHRAIFGWMILFSVAAAAGGCARREASPTTDYSYQLSAKSADTRTPDERQRKVTRPPVTAPLPSVLEHPVPLSVVAEVRVKREDGTQVFHRKIMRDADRVHVSYERQGQEWLFNRNSLDHRRATGKLVDHRRQRILEFFESDLSDAGVARGWAEVMSLGVPPEVLDGMVETGEAVTESGITFRRRVWKTKPEGDSIPDEVWWNAAHYLPLKIVRILDDGVWTQRLLRITFEKDATLLTEPAARFPAYEAMDMADWADCEADHGISTTAAIGRDHHHH